MVRWMSPILVACLVQPAMALREKQVSLEDVEHFGSHDLSHRIVAAAPSRKQPAGVEVDMGSLSLTVFGSFSADVGNSLLFITDVAGSSFVPNAIGNATIRYVAEYYSQSEVSPSLVTSVTFSVLELEGYSNEVRVNFNVTFDTPASRQAFRSTVGKDNGQKFMDSLNLHVPKRFRNKCRFPKSSLLEVAIAQPTAAPKSFGTVSFGQLADPLNITRTPGWEDALSMGIAQAAWLPRLQVGFMLAVEPPRNLSVTFWFTSQNPGCCKVNIERVERVADKLLERTYATLQYWSMMKALSPEHTVNGRIMLQVPDAALFASSSAAKSAVDMAVMRVATSLGKKDVKLSVIMANASLATVDVARGIVQVGFQVAYEDPKDRQVFAWEIAMGTADDLVSAINAQVPYPFTGQCQLPGQRGKKAINAKLGKIVGWMWFPVLTPAAAAAADSQLHEAMALAISEIALVPHAQVAIAMSPSAVGVTAYFWLASAESREAALLHVQAGPRWKSEILHRSILQLEKLRAQSQVVGQAESANVTLVLDVPNRTLFANSDAVREALRRAVSQVAAVPVVQVQHATDRLGWVESRPLGVRISFQMGFNGSQARQAFARTMASDGGAGLVMTINQQLPEPFRGTCRLPEDVGTAARAAVAPTTYMQKPGTTAAPPKASGTKATPQPSQQHGTIMLNVLHPKDFIAKVLVWYRISAAIAAVAMVPRDQVSLMLSMQSGTMVGVDFWVTSTNATLRQVAVQRVNAGWNNGALEHHQDDRTGLIFTACGGTVACCPASGAPYRC